MSTPIAKKDDVSIFSSLSISQQQCISPTPENMIIHNDTTNNVIKISNRVFEATTSIGYKLFLHLSIYLILQYFITFNITTIITIITIRIKTNSRRSILLNTRIL